MMNGERTRLRPVERADIQRFVKWFGDPEVREGLAMIAPIGEQHEERWFDDNSKRPPAHQAWAIDAQTTAGGTGFVTATAEPTWTHIGSCGFHDIDWRNRSGEVGIAIGDKTQWNKGFGTDAMRTLVGWGFGELNLNRIALYVYDDNRRAIRCYEKVGFKVDGRLREADFHAGRYRDEIVMSILRSEWPDK